MSQIAVKLNCPRKAFCLAFDTQIPSDKITALYGPSGSGKSTFIKALAGLEKWPNTVISFNHIIWQNDTIFLATHQRQIGAILQQDSLFPHLSIEQNILYGYKRNSQHLAIGELQNYYHQLNIQHLLNKYPTNLSGGELQKAALIRALATNPQLILLDEPFNALDENNREILLNMLRDYQQKHQIAIILVSHNSKEIAQIADHLIILKQGRIIHQGSYQQITTQAEINQHIASCYLALQGQWLNKEQAIIQIDNQQLSLYTNNDKKQHDQRLLINIQDISLSRQLIENSSVPYHLKATITEITSHFVRVKLKEQSLLCQTQPEIIKKLQLEINQEVYVNINHIDF